LFLLKKAKTPPNNIDFPYSNTELKHGAIYTSIKTMDFKLLDKNKKQFVASASCSRLTRQTVRVPGTRIELARPKTATRPSTLRVYQFHHPGKKNQEFENNHFFSNP
jgi:hypothetical protein